MNQNENRGRGFPVIAIVLGLVLLFTYLTSQTPQSQQYYEVVQLFKEEKKMTKVSLIQDYLTI